MNRLLTMTYQNHHNSLWTWEVFDEDSCLCLCSGEEESMEEASRAASKARDRLLQSPRRIRQDA
jgi:hypothetical protein